MKRYSATNDNSSNSAAKEGPSREDDLACYSLQLPPYALESMRREEALQREKPRVSGARGKTTRAPAAPAPSPGLSWDIPYMPDCSEDDEPPARKPRKGSQEDDPEMRSAIEQSYQSLREDADLQHALALSMQETSSARGARTQGKSGKGRAGVFDWQRHIGDSLGMQEEAHLLEEHGGPRSLQGAGYALDGPGGWNDAKDEFHLQEFLEEAKKKYTNKNKENPALAAALRRKKEQENVGRPGRAARARPGPGSPVHDGEYPPVSQAQMDKVRSMIAARVFSKMYEIEQKLFTPGGATAKERVLDLPEFLPVHYTHFLGFLCNQPVVPSTARKYRYCDFIVFTDQMIRENHDFIAIICPTYDVARSNPDADKYSPDDAYWLCNSRVLSERYLHAIKKILNAIGLNIDWSGSQVFVTNEETFLTCVNATHTHMLMRISRILRSMRLMGFSSLTRSLFRTLMIYVESPKKSTKLDVPEKTVFHWYEAADIDIN